MQPIEYYLDEILKQLDKDREKPLADRNHLNPDIVLREVLKTDPDRYEDFYELMVILESAGYIKRMNPNLVISDKDKYRDCITTMKGSFFISKQGGYTQTIINAASENSRLKAVETQTLWLTRILAFGALIAAIYYLVELYWEHGWFRFCYH